MSDAPPRPTTLDEYLNWFAGIWPVDTRPFGDWDWHADKLANPERFPASLWEFQQDHYNNIATELAQEFNHSPFWDRVWNDLSVRSQQYYQSSPNYSLLAHPTDRPQAVAKPWKSLLEKSFRKNVLNNKSWPSPPPKGWVTPDNWWQTITDLIRTTVVVKYLDGVKIVGDVVSTAAEALAALMNDEKEAQLAGYYARHLTIRLPLSRQIPVEIQVCTQVQEVLRTLTHQFYVERRLEPTLSMSDLLWDYRGKHFAPCYLGHILHYADGEIMNIRHREEERP